MQGLVGDSIHTARAGCRSASPSARPSRRSTNSVDDAFSGEHGGEKAVGAAVQIVVDDDAVARVQQRQHGGFGGHAGGECKAEAAAFERRQTILQRFAGGVAAARIVEWPRLAHSAEGERGGQINGRHDGAVSGIGRLPGMNRPSAKTGRAWLVHGKLNYRVADLFIGQRPLLTQRCSCAFPRG
jgi:hypothetical protein